LGPTTGKSDYLGEVGRDTILTLTALRSVFPRSVGQTGGLSCPSCGRGGIVSASSDLALTEPNLGRALDDSMSAAVKGSVAVDTDAAGGAAEAVKVGEYTLTQTITKHLASRPYYQSPLTLREIMAAGKPIPDPGGVAGALRWDVPGAFRGSAGTWELVVDPQSKTILHWLFRSASKPAP